LEKFAITPKLVEFVDQLAQNDELFLHFPLDNWDANYKPSLAQEKHLLLIQIEVPALAQLLQKLCPTSLPSNKFWRIYFELVRNRVSQVLQNESTSDQIEKDFQEGKRERERERERLMPKNSFDTPLFFFFLASHYNRLKKK
jgi:hypothetical protein